MRLSYHDSVDRDLAKILLHYKGISHQLRDDFWEEMTAALRSAARTPQRYHFEPTGKRRRVNLKKFPSHFLFREFSGGIRITVVRHNKQRPSYGLRRI